MAATSDNNLLQFGFAHWHLATQICKTFGFSLCIGHRCIGYMLSLNVKWKKNVSTNTVFYHVLVRACKSLVCVRRRGTKLYLRLEMASTPKWRAESGRFPMTHSHGIWDNRWSTTLGTQHLAHSHSNFSAHTKHGHHLIHNYCFDQIMYSTRLRWSNGRQPLVDSCFCSLCIAYLCIGYILKLNVECKDDGVNQKYGF